MDYGAIDQHKKDVRSELSQRVVRSSTDAIATDPRFAWRPCFEGRRPMRILLGGLHRECEWLAQHLETLGHEVIVTEPTFAPMHSERGRRVKTDSSSESLQHGAQ